MHELSGEGPAISMTNRGMKGAVTFDAAAFVPAPPPAASRPPRYLPPEGDAFATIVRRAAESSIGPTETPPTDSVIAQRLRARDFVARAAWGTLIRTPDRTHLWGDTRSSNSALLTREAGRIEAMAAAWAGASEIDSPGLRGNPQLLADTLAALETFLDHRWTPATKWGVNWWDYEIGVPRGVFGAMCVLGPHVTPELKAKAMAAMEHFTADP